MAVGGFCLTYCRACPEQGVAASAQPCAPASSSGVSKERLASFILTLIRTALTVCASSQNSALSGVMEDHQRVIPMAQHIMPFMFGVVGPVTLVAWVILR